MRQKKQATITLTFHRHDRALMSMKPGDTFTVRRIKLGKTGKDRWGWYEEASKMTLVVNKEKL